MPLIKHIVRVNYICIILNFGLRELYVAIMFELDHQPWPEQFFVVLKITLYKILHDFYESINTSSTVITNLSIFSFTKAFFDQKYSYCWLKHEVLPATYSSSNSWFHSFFLIVYETAYEKSDTISMFKTVSFLHSYWILLRNKLQKNIISILDEFLSKGGKNPYV